MIDENLTLDEIKEIFSNDRFATKCTGCRIIEARKGYAVCEMDITEDHRNAQGGVMGGAIYTLADFAFALATNIGQLGSVAIDASIQFINGAKGTKLIATAKAEKMGRSLAFFTIDVVDDLGTCVAHVSSTSARVER